MKPRPVIVNFLNVADKEKIRSLHYKLQRPLGISEDLPYDVRKARESLLPELRELKNRGKKASIVYPARLISEGNVVHDINVMDFKYKQDQDSGDSSNEHCLSLNVNGHAEEKCKYCNFVNNVLFVSDNSNDIIYSDPYTNGNVAQINNTYYTCTNVNANKSCISPKNVNRNIEDNTKYSNVNVANLYIYNECVSKNYVHNNCYDYVNPDNIFYPKLICDSEVYEHCVNYHNVNPNILNMNSNDTCETIEQVSNYGTDKPNDVQPNTCSGNNVNLDFIGISEVNKSNNSHNRQNHVFW